ncbi:MAG: serine--tRNA ligase, partial [Pseudomonadota bacterium]
MIDYRYIEQYRERIERSLRLRGSDFELGPIDTLGLKRRRFQTELDAKRARVNALSSEIGKLFTDKNADPKKGEPLKEESGRLKKEIQAGEKASADLESDLSEKLLYLPNVLHESVAEGRSSADNPVVRTWGEPKNPVSKPKPHDVLGSELGILDFERAGKVSGARFVFLRGWGARLERAILNFMMDLHRSRGYEEIWPPFLVSRATMTGTGQLPKFEEEAFKIADPEFFLIPTAEVPVTNLFREETVPEEILPKSFVAFSACFRREAGSYGKDTKGLIRQHQFDKVELVKFARPEESYDALEKLTGDAEEVLKRLELSYRVVTLCSADTGFGSAKTYDLEVWLPGQGEYR